MSEKDQTEAQTPAATYFTAEERRKHPHYVAALCRIVASTGTSYGDIVWPFPFDHAFREVAANASALDPYPDLALADVPYGTEDDPGWEVLRNDENQLVLLEETGRYRARLGPCGSLTLYHYHDDVRARVEASWGPQDQCLRTDNLSELVEVLTDLLAISEGRFPESVTP